MGYDAEFALPRGAARPGDERATFALSEALPSPYLGQERDCWAGITERVVAAHPLAMPDLRDCALAAWTAVSGISIAQYGKALIYDGPALGSAIGGLFQFCLSAEMERRFPGVWRLGRGIEKDLTNVVEPATSIEAKASGHPSGIFGNRCSTKISARRRKHRGGYYLALNYDLSRGRGAENVTALRFGWLDDEDWVGQSSQTGNQARIPADIASLKLLSILGCRT